MAKYVNLAVKNGLKNPRKNRVLVLEDLDFLWDRPELKEMVQLWEQNLSVSEISEHFERDGDEILVALIHLGREGKLKGRKGGLFGGYS